VAFIFRSTDGSEAGGLEKEITAIEQLMEVPARGACPEIIRV
jgi:hypothetical protein